MLAALRERAVEAGVRNVAAVLVPLDDPGLPAASVDLAFVCDTYHHLDDRPAYLERLRRVLRPGGRLAIVDFQKRETPVGPPLPMRVDRKDVIAECAAAGFTLASEMAFLPHQYGLVFRR
jgi:ubiquinone/menaquinone biosynthesis C-methylase UbiE